MLDIGELLLRVKVDDSEIGDLEGKLKSGLDNVSKRAAAGAAAITGVGVATYNEYEKVNKIIAQSGGIMNATAEDTKAMFEAAADGAAQTTFSVEDAANVMLTYAKAGIDAKDAIGLLNPTLQAAMGTTTDTTVAAQGLLGVMNGFGLPMQEANKYMDELVATANGADMSFDELAMSVAKGAPAFNAAGYSAEDYLAALDMMAEKEIPVNEGANALSNGLMRLTGHNKNVTEALDRLNVKLTNSDGSMRDFGDIIGDLSVAFEGLSESEKLQAAQDLFGQNQAKKWIPLIESGKKSFEGYKNQIQGATGVTQDLAKTMMDAAPMEQLKSSWDALKVSLGSVIAETLVPLIQKITELLDKFRNMDPETQKLIVRVGEITAAVLAGIAVFSKVASVIMSIVNVVKIVVPLFSGLGTAIAAIGGPVTIVIGVIAALAAGIKHLWDTNEEFRAKVIEIWEGLKTTLGAAIDHIKEKLNSLGINFDSIKEAFGNFVDWIENAFGVVLTSAFEFVTGVISDALDVILATFDFFADLFSGNWSALWEDVKNLVLSILNLIIPGFSEFCTAVQNLLTAFAAFVSNAWNTLWTTVKNFCESTWNALTEFLKTTWEKIKSECNRIWTDIKNFLNTSMEAIKKLLEDGWNKVKETVIKVWTAIKDAIAKKWEEIKNAAQEGMQKIHDKIYSFKDAFANLGSALGSALKDKFMGFINSIKDAIEEVWSRIMSAKDAVGNFFSGGSWRTGLEYVPRDGYIAELHRGERVLTADEAARYAAQETTPTPSNMVTNNFNITVPSNDNAIKTAISLRDLIRKEEYKFA